jgi:hypothetical protein
MYALAFLGALIFVPAIGAIDDSMTSRLFVRCCGLAGIRACYRAPAADGQPRRRIQGLWMESGK